MKFRYTVIISRGFFFILLITFFNSCSGTRQLNNTVQLISNDLIWEEASHNAFTTIESDGEFMYTAFREGSNHKSYDGKIRIIRSKDGLDWESVLLIQQLDEDLRDPKFVFYNNRRLLLIVSRTENKHYSYTYSSEDGLNWELLNKTEDTWRWNATEKNGLVFSVGYSGIDKSGSIYVTKQGKEWEQLKSDFFPDKRMLPNETKLFFNSKEDLIALVRQERGSQNAILGMSSPPYSNWLWKDLGVRMGSPSGIMLNDEFILACVRLYDLPIRTSFVVINVKTGDLKEDLIFPSGGDTGYADIVKHKGKIYVSYHSSKNKKRKTSIYLAEIKIKDE